MMTSTKATFNINMEKYRLRRFVDRLVDMDEVEIHDVMPSREDRNNRISALKFSGTMPPQLPVLFALIQILLGCDRRRRIRAPFGAL